MEIESKVFLLSLQAFLGAWQSTAVPSLREKSLDFSWQNKGYRSALADVSLESILDSRFWVFGLWIATPLCAARDDDELESRLLDSRSGLMDCRATAGAVSRNDEEAWLSSSRIVELESGLCAFDSTCSRLDLGDKNGALQGESKART